MRNEYIKQAASSTRCTLASDIANKIVKYIEEAGLQPGDRIPGEIALASQFGVGRSTVREAVKQLVALNVLKILPAKGTFVSDNMGLIDDPLGLGFMQDNEQMVNDLIDLRLMLECYAARKAALNANEDQIAGMKKILNEIDASSSNNDRCLSLDIDFHKLLAESSGNSVMPILSPIIHSNMFHFLHVPIERKWPIINSAHWAVVKAIEIHNPVLAEAEMVKHISYISTEM